MTPSLIYSLRQDRRSFNKSRGLRRAAATFGALLALATGSAGDMVPLTAPELFRKSGGEMRGPVVYMLTPANAGGHPEDYFKRLVLMPDSARLVENDDSVRPGGTACLIKAHLDQAGSGAVSLKLTEFQEPNGEGIYFQLADPRWTSRDEHLAGDTRQTNQAGSEPTYYVTSTPR